MQEKIKGLKLTILNLQLESLKKQKHDSENNFKSTESLSYFPPDIFKCCKKSGPWKHNYPALQKKRKI